LEKYLEKLARNCCRKIAGVRKANGRVISPALVFETYSTALKKAATFVLVPQE